MEEEEKEWENKRKGREIQKIETFHILFCSKTINFSTQYKYFPQHFYKSKIKYESDLQGLALEYSGSQYKVSGDISFW